MAGWFKHLGGIVLLGVELPDGSTATVPAEATDVFGDRASPGAALVLDAEGLRGLRALTVRLLQVARDGSGR